MDEKRKNDEPQRDFKPVGLREFVLAALIIGLPILMMLACMVFVLFMMGFPAQS